MSPQFRAAFWRALGAASLSAGLVFFTTLGTEAEWRVIVSATGAAFMGAGVWRGVFEGAWDTHRADTGDVKPSDVQRIPAPERTPYA